MCRNTTSTNNDEKKNASTNPEDHGTRSGRAPPALPRPSDLAAVVEPGAGIDATQVTAVLALRDDNADNHDKVKKEKGIATGGGTDDYDTEFTGTTTGGLPVAEHHIMRYVHDDDEEGKELAEQQVKTSDGMVMGTSATTTTTTTKTNRDDKPSVKETTDGVALGYGTTIQVRKMATAKHILGYVVEEDPATATATARGAESETPSVEGGGGSSTAPPPTVLSSSGNDSGPTTATTTTSHPGAYAADETGMERLTVIHRNSFSSATIPFADIEAELSDSTDHEDNPVARDTSGLAVANAVEDDIYHLQNLPRATQQHHGHHGEGGNNNRPSMSREEQDRQRNSCFLLGCIAVMAVVGVAIALPALMSSASSSSSPSTSPTTTTATASDVVLTAPPSSLEDDTNVVGTASSSASSLLEGSILSLLPEETILVATEDPDSPQAKAWQWLLQDEDALVLLLSASDSNDSKRNHEQRTIQRFVLATLFFAAGGDDDGEGWTNNTHWLDHSIHECHWFTKSDYARKNVLSTLFEGYLSGILEPLPDQKCDQDGLYQHLWIDGNNLVGSLPEELYLLTSLQSLSIGFNPALGGSISSKIGQLTVLQALHLGDMEWAGELPSELGLLTNLQHLEIWGSTFQLGGTLPSGIFSRLTNLIHLGIAASPGLKGTIPSTIGSLQKLSWLAMVYNNLSGPIPSEIGLLESLKVIQLDQNQFTGTIPTQVGLLDKTRLLSMRSNQLFGTVPTELGALTATTQLSFSTNSLLTGTMPSELGLLTELTVTLNFENNLLTGTIPSDFGSFENLYELKLQNNQLSGPIPSELVHLSSIRQLSCANNSLSGIVPEELLLALSHTLHAVSLEGNPLLTGEGLPEELCNLNNTCVRTPWNTAGCNMEPGISFDCTGELRGCGCV